MKSAYLAKINVLLQFGDEILALSCSKRVRTKTKLQGFVWRHWSMKGPISHPQITIRHFEEDRGPFLESPGNFSGP